MLGCRGGVGVGGQGEAGVAVAQHGGDGFHVHAVLQFLQNAAPAFALFVISIFLFYVYSSISKNRLSDCRNHSAV